MRTLTENRRTGPQNGRKIENKMSEVGREKTKHNTTEQGTGTGKVETEIGTGIKTNSNTDALVRRMDVKMNK